MFILCKHNKQAPHSTKQSLHLHENDKCWNYILTNTGIGDYAYDQFDSDYVC